ncbi:hypothetical protein [Vibrio cionasavignyae]|uniref:hypothetical protein n=1 Tax=Vibrio cionasavignyae TaxID=2910252 RepID=UPI003D0D1676
MDISLKQVLFALLLTVVCNVQADEMECNSTPIPNELHIIDKGTFMLSIKGGHAPVSSYLPSGTIVRLLGIQPIDYQKRQGRQPITQCYFYVKTTLGKYGYVLKSTLVSSSSYIGEFVFPRTEIEIFKRPNLESVSDYRAGNSALRRTVFMSSTNPKVDEKLQVIGMDSEQDFYIVKAKFLGENVKGYVFADDIEQGMAAVINPQNAIFIDRVTNKKSNDLEDIFKSLLSEKIYKELSNYLQDNTNNTILELCRTPLSVTPSVELKANAWWINGAIKVESKILLKPQYRSFSYESYSIKKGDKQYDIDFIKHLSCDTESMLYPVILKVKQGELELRRENFRALPSIFRNKEDFVGKNQYETILTINSYGDWYSVYRYLDNNLSNWRAIYGDSYYVLIDILIDSISYFPPSEKRTTPKSS